MQFSIIMNYLLDARCVLCNGRGLSREIAGICDKCFNYFDLNIHDSCNICHHPLSKDGKCHSCVKLGKIYYDSYSFIQYYTGYFQSIISMLKLSQKFSINKLLAELLIKKRLIKNDGIVTVVPDDLLKALRKGRSGLRYVLKILRSKKFKIISNIYKRKFSINNFQKNKNDYGRLKKIENLFYLPKKNRDKFSGRIYLIDDVYTTGSTLNYGAKLLKQAGFTEVHIISFFRAVMNYY